MVFLLFTSLSLFCFSPSLPLLLIFFDILTSPPHSFTLSVSLFHSLSLSLFSPFLSHSQIRSNSGLTDSSPPHRNVRAIIRFRPETSLVSEAEELGRAGGVEVAAVVLEDVEDGGVLGEGGGLVGGESGGEAVEDGVVKVRYLRRVGEFGGVPVVVGREDGRLGESVDSDNEGLQIGGL